MTFQEFQKQCSDLIAQKRRFMNAIAIYRKMIQFKKAYDYFGEYDYYWDIEGAYANLSEENMIYWLTTIDAKDKNISPNILKMKSTFELESINDVISQELTEFRENSLGYLVKHMRAEEQFQEDNFIDIGHSAVIRGELRDGHIYTKSHRIRIDDDIGISYSSDRVRIDEEILEVPQNDYSQYLLSARKWQKKFLPEMFI